MAQGDLYKIGRLVDNTIFRVRVRAAMLITAQTKLAATAAEERNLAVWVLLNPQADEMSMVSLVAADTTVLGQATVAKKYPTSPLTPSGV